MARGSSGGTVEAPIARWHVDGYDWKDFVALDETLRASDDGRFSLRSASSAVQETDVLVTRAGIAFAGAEYKVSPRGNPEIQEARLHESRVRPSFLELSLKYHDGGTGASGTLRHATYAVLRVPVPRAAVAQGRVIAAYFNGDTPAVPDFFHGAGDGSDTEDLSSCWHCGFETHKYRSECPKCGSSLQSRRWSRRFGMGLTLAGLLISGGSGWLLTVVLPLLSRGNAAGASVRFSGTTTQALAIGLIIAMVFAFGVTALLYGLWQVRTGKRSKRVVLTMLGVVSAISIVRVLLIYG